MLPIGEGPATELSKLYRTLRPDPLVGAEELRRYYRGQLNQVRGEDTEMSRLLERVKGQHVGVRLSVADELNPASFKVFDILLPMLARLAEQADRMGETGDTENALSLLRKCYVACRKVLGDHHADTAGTAEFLHRWESASALPPRSVAG